MKKITGLLLVMNLVIYVGCKKDTHPVTPPAKGSLQDERGLCMPGTVHGNWYNGISAGTDTNYVDVSVNVTSTGSYRIATDRQNGVMFADSGNFNSTGLNVVRLKPTGTFINSGYVDFNTTFDSSACQFRINIQDSTGLSIADNTFQFTAGGQQYKGTIRSSNFYSLPGNLGGQFDVVGSQAGFSDTTMFMDFYLPTGGLDTASYLTSTNGNDFGFTTSRSYTGKKVSFSASYYTTPAVLDLHPTSWTSQNGPQPILSTILGTFNGTARDTANNIVPITNARFKIVF